MDGSYPFDETASYAITPGQKVNYTVPTVQLVTGFDPIISGYHLIQSIFVAGLSCDLFFYIDVSGGACAPEKLSGPRFFDAMTGPTWYINTTAFGHGDILDAPYEQIVEVYSSFIIEKKFCNQQIIEPILNR